MRQLIVCVLLAGMLGCVGCGAPLYPERQFSVNPRTGQVSFSSTQEEDLIIGQFTARDGDREVTLGTTTQPAVVYGAKSVAAMDAYSRQIIEYTKLLDVVGDDITADIRALGEWIPGIASMLSGMGASPASIDTALAPAKALLSSLTTKKALIDASCNGNKCPQ